MHNDNQTIRKYWPWITWTYRSIEPYAYAMIRFFTGAVLLTHGCARLFSANPSFGFNAYLTGLSPAVVGAFELIGGVMLALGVLTRPVALLTGLLWLAFALGHTPSGRPQSWFMLGAIDHFPAMVTALCLAFFCRGGGRHSLDRKIAASKPVSPQSAGFFALTAPLSYPFIRIVMGLMFLPSGIDKIFLGGYARIAEGNIAALGLEPKYAWALAVGCVELSGGILMILGLFTRPAAFAVAVMLSVITFGIQINSGYFWSSRGFEVGLLMDLIFLCFCFGGGGRYSLDRRIGREW